jgi:hypothetical protein
MLQQQLFCSNCCSNASNFYFLRKFCSNKGSIRTKFCLNRGSFWTNFCSNKVLFEQWRICSNKGSILSKFCSNKGSVRTKVLFEQRFYIFEQGFYLNKVLFQTKVLFVQRFYSNKGSIRTRVLFKQSFVSNKGSVRTKVLFEQSSVRTKVRFEQPQRRPFPQSLKNANSLKTPFFPFFACLCFWRRLLSKKLILTWNCISEKTWRASNFIWPMALYSVATRYLLRVDFTSLHFCPNLMGEKHRPAITLESHTDNFYFKLQTRFYLAKVDKNSFLSVRTPKRPYNLYFHICD